MRSAALVLLAVALVACGDDDDEAATSTSATSTSATATTSSTTTSTSTTVAPTTSVATTLPSGAVVPEGFDQVAATVTAADGTVCELCLWLAATGEQRALGLMYVTDLGG